MEDIAPPSPIRLRPIFSAFVSDPAAAKALQGQVRGPFLIYVDGYRVVLIRDDDSVEQASEVARLVQEPSNLDPGV